MTLQFGYGLNCNRHPKIRRPMKAFEKIERNIFTKVIVINERNSG